MAKKSQVKNLDAGRPVALVMGGTGGIGREVVNGLMEAGFAVVVQYHHNKKGAAQIAKICAAESIPCLTYQAEIRSPLQMKALMRQIQKRFGRLDALVNTVGVNLTQNMKSFDLKDFARILQINLTSGALVAKLAHPLLRNSKQGRVILFGSIASYVGSPRRIGYVASKSGLIGLTHSLALEYAEDGILVNCIIPGYTDTPSYWKYNTVSPKERLSHLPLKRIAVPKEIADVAVFLCSSKASYVTGQSIHVNGGTYLT